MNNEQGVPYSESVEVKQPNEDEYVKEIRASFGRMREAAYEKHRHAVRDAPAKSHGILKGEPQIYDNALRGMAIKIVGVEGGKILPQLKDAVTQDFLLCNHPTIAAGDVSSYLKQALIIEKATQQPEELQKVLTTVLRGGSAALRSVGVDAVGGAGGQVMRETHILGDRKVLKNCRIEKKIFNKMLDRRNRSV